jgi:hypothetical protein
MRANLHIVVHGKTNESVEKQLTEVILNYLGSEDPADMNKVEVEYHAMYSTEIPKEWMPPTEEINPKELPWGFEARADVRIKKDD